MRPMKNPVNILRSMAKHDPRWYDDARWQRSIRRVRRLERKFRKQRAKEREARSPTLLGILDDSKT